MKTYLYLLITLIAFKTKSERNAISQASRKGGKAFKKKEYGKYEKSHGRNDRHGLKTNK